MTTEELTKAALELSEKNGITPAAAVDEIKSAEMKKPLKDIVDKK